MFDWLDRWLTENITEKRIRTSPLQTAFKLFFKQVLSADSSYQNVVSSYHQLNYSQSNKRLSSNTSAYS